MRFTASNPTHSVPGIFRVSFQNGLKPQSTISDFFCVPGTSPEQFQFFDTDSNHNFFVHFDFCSIWCRTAVLDYLPRVNLEVVKGTLMTTEKSVLCVMLQNRHLHEAQIRFDAAVNDEDLYSTAKIECSSEWFTIDRADIHIMGGPQRDEKRENGDYVKGKEAGILVTVTPKHYSTGPRDVKFSIRCTFKTKLQLKEDQKDGNHKSSNDDKNKKSGKQQQPLCEVQMPYILDFDLGPPKTAKTPDADKDAAVSSAVTVTDATATPSSSATATAAATGSDPSSLKI